MGGRGKWKWKRVPMTLVMLLAAAEMLSLSGPVGAAPAVSSAEVLGAAAPAAAAVLETLDQPGMRAMAAKIPRPSPETEPETAVPAGPDVPEGETVEDAYFDDAVFLGDSRTEGFRLYSGLKTGTYLCATGATVESVFSRNVLDTGAGKVPLMDGLSDVACGKIYVMLGINELGWPRTEDFRDQYAKIVDRVREVHPDAKIVLQSILPVSAKYNARGSYINNDRIAVFNQIVRDLAEEKECFYLDVSAAVTGEDGCLKPELNFDGVHLNPAGCRLWLEYLRTHSV